MRVLFIHAFYQRPGGEDRVVEFEARQLERRGHEVAWIRFHNDEMRDWSTARTATSLFWNGKAYDDVRELVRRFRPDVIHVQNVFPSLSPSVYWAAEAEGIPVVQKLSNYRMFCANGVLFRDGKPCEQCLTRRVAVPGIVHACYRDSRIMSAGVALSHAAQRMFGTWHDRIAAYVALDEDGRERFIRAGLRPEKVHVKPESVEIPAVPGTGSGGYVLFAGRLSAEKGIGTLISAWLDHAPALPLVVAGDGPEAERVRSAAAAANGRITWVGHLEPDELERRMGEAAALVVPSEWFEMFGRTAVEAMALGTPVVAARIGALRNVIQDGISGTHFTPGDGRDLADAVDRISRNQDPVGLRARTREQAVERYSPEVDYARQMAIYEAVVGA